MVKTSEYSLDIIHECEKVKSGECAAKIASSCIDIEYSNNDY